MERLANIYKKNLKTYKYFAVYFKHHILLFNSCFLFHQIPNEKPGGGPMYRPIQYPEEIQAALAQVNTAVSVPLHKTVVVSFLRFIPTRIKN